MSRTLGAQQLLEMRNVVVAKLEHAAAAQGSARAQAAMGELVQEDEVAAADERRNHADVRQVPAAEDDRVLGTLERRELALELDVKRMIAVDEPRGAGADTEAPRRVDARGDDVGMMR